jgi:hypothetical protein
MQFQMQSYRGSHELLVGCALGAALAALSAFWWMYTVLHG